MSRTRHDEKNDETPAKRNADQLCRSDVLNEALSGAYTTEQHVEHLLDHLDRKQ